jgi:hypothetical protein
MPRLNVVSLSGVFLFLPVGSRVDVSNEFGIKIDHTEEQYLSINEQVKKENPRYHFIWLSTNKASSPPSEPMVLKYFKTYYFASYGSTVF